MVEFPVGNRVVGQVEGAFQNLITYPHVVTLLDNRWRFDKEQVGCGAIRFVHNCFLNFELM